MFRFFFILIFPFLSVKAAFASGEINPEFLERAKKAIVTIETRASLSAYNSNGNWSGTGFLTDAKNGFIVTNRHVTGAPCVATYFVTFHNGKEAQAKLLYYDLWQDYAILKISPSDLPDSFGEIKISKDPVKQNDKVTIVGNNEGKDFSFQIGYISNIYEIAGEMPQASYVINLNTTGGSSGSPILNAKNEAIGLQHGGGKTFALALKAVYLSHAIEALEKGAFPQRKHIGLITEPYSLDKAVKHRSFPREIMEEYLKKFPDSRNKVLSVRSIIAGSKAEGIILPGDILWEADGKFLAADLSELDLILSRSGKDSVELTIYRDGQKTVKKVPSYDINKNKIERIVDFAGAVFFESDDYESAKTGFPLNALAVANVQNGSSFSAVPVSFFQGERNLFRLSVTSLGDYKVSSIADLVNNLPKIKEKKFITVGFKNYQPYFPYYQFADSSFVSSQNQMLSDLVLDAIGAQHRIFAYDAKNMEWALEEKGK